MVLHLFDLALSLSVRPSLSAPGGWPVLNIYLLLEFPPHPLVWPLARPAFKPWSFWCPLWVSVPPLSCCQPCPDFQALPTPWDDTGSLSSITLRREFCVNLEPSVQSNRKPYQRKRELNGSYHCQPSPNPREMGGAQRPPHHETASEWNGRVGGGSGMGAGG